MIKVIILDTETTGLPLPGLADLSKQPKIIELGLVVVKKYEYGWKRVGEKNWLINPGQLLDPIITKITGIKDSDLIDKPSFGEILGDLKSIFRNSDFLIAHNAPFDTSLMEFDLMRVGCDDFPWARQTICSVQEYFPEFGHRPKLTELYEKKVGKPLAQTHKAVDDANALYECLMADGYFEILENTI